MSTHYYFYDLNGNVTGLLRKEAGGTLAVAARYGYDPFGKTVTQEAVGTADDYAWANPFRFATKMRDFVNSETINGFDTDLEREAGRLDYYGFRYYSPQSGRWFSRDPIGERGGLNLYGMVDNDAVNWVDVLGLQANEYDTVRDAADAGAAEADRLTNSSENKGRLSKGSIIPTKTPENQFGRRMVAPRDLEIEYEYCGLVCKIKKDDGSCKYVYTQPIRGSTVFVDRGDYFEPEYSCKPGDSPCKEGGERVGSYHSEPKGSRQGKSDIEPSEADWNLAHANGAQDPAHPENPEARLTEPFSIGSGGHTRHFPSRPMSR